MAKNESRPPVPVWRGANYVRVPEGRYRAVAVRYQGPEWVLAFSRWSLLVEFELLDDGTRVCAFYNFGNDRAEPKIARGGNYFKAWTRANGELPRKGQAMSQDVFLEGQLYTLEVKDSRRNGQEKEKNDAEIYSVVAEIVGVERRSAPADLGSPPNQESSNQESRITQSPNQAINQSGWPVRGKAQNSPSFALAGRR
jgi:hypothetical protein